MQFLGMFIDTFLTGLAGEYTSRHSSKDLTAPVRVSMFQGHCQALTSITEGKQTHPACCQMWDAEARRGNGRGHDRGAARRPCPNILLAYGSLII
jgi:hypothetical protein